jgi:hypothetical protein
VRRHERVVDVDEVQRHEARPRRHLGVSADPPDVVCVPQP